MPGHIDYTDMASDQCEFGSVSLDYKIGIMTSHTNYTDIASDQCEFGNVSSD